MTGALRVLGIETSCDETAAAIVSDGRIICSSVVSSQVALHAPYGGVVPEVASRAHVDLIGPVIARSLIEGGLDYSDIDAVAACCGPGLAGALLVGVSAAKALALVIDKPYVGVNHLEAHLFAAFLDDPSLEPPLVVLLVSGGHTLIVHVGERGRYKILGQTVDDAAGEAFDKVARVLGLGYPGGPAIDHASVDGDASAISFPRPMLSDGYTFSFSGLKTSVVNHLRHHPESNILDVAASFQEAVVDVLATKLMRAARQIGVGSIAIGGGVAANSRLRTRLIDEAASAGLNFSLPSPERCTDNGAMIAAAGWWRLGADGPTSLDSGINPNLPIPE